MQNSPLTEAMRDIRVSVYDGKMHPVDSNDISFKIAGLQAFRQAFNEADPQLLEPVYEVEVFCPDDQVGAVMSDLQTRMAVVEGMEADGHFQKNHREGAAFANAPVFFHTSQPNQGQGPL